mmetsp:Transcript_64405/g.119770  ORF Transcript_64405/g.119770 Transcript_64405/m.119770 type:complete len:109 (-) Transcript_64405:2-328(-)
MASKHLKPDDGNDVSTDSHHILPQSMAKDRLREPPGAAGTSIIAPVFRRRFLLPGSECADQHTGQLVRGSGWVRQDTHGMPSLVPVPRKRKRALLRDILYKHPLLYWS